LFNKISDKNVVLWSGMITGYGMHGYAMQGLWKMDGNTLIA
jgi:hypothetical protein